MNVYRDSAAHRILAYLISAGPSSAQILGERAFLGRRTRQNGRIGASQGGGDYAAQMLLGRLKRAGIVQHASSGDYDGCSLWEITTKGRKILQHDLRPAKRPVRHAIRLEPGQAIEIQRDPGAAWEPAVYHGAVSAMDDRPSRRGWHTVDLPSSAAPRIDTFAGREYPSRRLVVPTRRIRPREQVDR